MSCALYNVEIAVSGVSHSGLCVQGTGTSDEMALEERTTIATEGCVIADVAVIRPPLTPAQAAAQAQASTSGRGPDAAAAAARRAARAAAAEAEALGQPPPPPPRLQARVRVKTLAMWTDQGRLGQELCRVRPPTPRWPPPSRNRHASLLPAAFACQGL